MIGSSESWGLNSTHFHGTHVPVEEPSTASEADIALRTYLTAEADSSTSQLRLCILLST
jgi:hypothetical protein